MLESPSILEPFLVNTEHYNIETTILYYISKAHIDYPFFESRIQNIYAYVASPERSRSLLEFRHLGCSQGFQQ